MAHRLVRRIAMLAVLVAFGGLAAAGPGPALAQGWTAFQARGIKVDVTAGNAAEARAEAIRQGEQAAFRQMLENLTAPEDHGRLPQIDPATISQLVLGFEVEDEKASGVRYIATLAYRFDAEGVRAILRNNAIPFAETQRRPLVVLPVLRSGGQALLWEDPNPWRAAWADYAARGGLVPIVAPIGDLVDISKVQAPQAISGDSAALVEFAQRYQADDALVAIADRSPDGALSVSATRYGPEGGVPVGTARAPASDDEGFRMAIQAIISNLEAEWKRRNLIQTNVRGSLIALVPVQNLSDWVLVQRRLTQVPSVASATLVHLQRGQAQVAIDYFGTVEQLQSAMARGRLDLRQGAIDWVLSLPGGVPLPGGAATDDEPLNAPGTPRPATPATGQ